MRRLFNGRMTAAIIGTTALIASACGAGGGGGTPAEQLTASLQTLTGEDFAWSMTIDASSGALSSAAQDVDAVGAVAPFLTSFKISGERVGENASMTLGVMGADVLSMRTIGEEQVFVRLDIQGLLDLAQVDASELIRDLGDQGLPAPMLSTATAAIAGEWIGLQVDAEELASMFGADATGGEDMQAATDALMAMFSDPASLIERMGTVTTSDAEDGGTIYDVALDPKAMADFLITEIAPVLSESVAGYDPADIGDMEAELNQALEGAPASIPGLRITVVGGLVTMIQLDIAQVAAAFGAELPEGESAGITFAFERDGLAPIEAPATDNILTTEDFASLMGFATMMG